MQVLVTGAGGFLGTWLVKLLLEQGHSVRALVRRPLGAAAALGIEEVLGDITDPQALRKAVTGCQWIFHLAGVRRAARQEDFFSVNAGGTELLLEACLAASPPPRRFILAGSQAAAGPSRQAKREEDGLDPCEWYGASKAAAERLAFSFRDRLEVTVARPARITGPGDRENLFFFRLVQRGLVIGVRGSPRPLSFIDVEDCARGLLLLAEHPGAVGESFFLAHPQPTDLEGLQFQAARALGVEPRPIRVPSFALRTIGTAADVISRIAGRRLPLNRKLVEQVLAPGWTCDSSKARRVLGFEPGISLVDSMNRAARWYLDQGWL